MDSSKQHFEDQQPVSGMMTDLKSLRGNTQASVGELREFLGSLKGRSPQEVMGIVASSSLVQGITTATVATIVLLLVFTVGPWLMEDSSAAATPPQERPVAAAATPEAEEPAPSTDTAAEDAMGESATPDLERAADAMGINGSADAPPDENPLDNRLDKLLDGIE